MTIETTQLHKCSLFKNMPADEITALLEVLDYRIYRYPKNALIRLQGDRYRELLLVLEGDISAEIQDLSGKTIKIETLSAGAVIASGVLFAADNTLPVSLNAHSTVKLLAVPKKAVISLCHRHQKFLENLLSDTGDKIIFLAEKIRLLKFASLEEKLAGYLLHQSIKQKNDRVSLIYNLKQLADLFGVARPSLSRVFSQLYAQGILLRDRKFIKILDKDKLRLLLKP